MRAVGFVEAARILGGQFSDAIQMKLMHYRILQCSVTRVPRFGGSLHGLKFSLFNLLIEGFGSL